MEMSLIALIPLGPDCSYCHDSHSDMSLIYLLTCLITEKLLFRDSSELSTRLVPEPQREQKQIQSLWITY